MRNNKPILLVEDDRVDQITVKKSLAEINVTNKLIIANNGEEALRILNDPNNELPCIILLDLNMPKMNGIEFLKIVKNETNLKAIPVIVMTTSHEEQDKLQSFNLGVAGYMLKPVDYIEFVRVVKAINFYWTLSELP